MTLAEKEKIKDTQILSAIDKLIIVKGLEHVKSMSIVDTSDIDNVIIKVKKL